MKDAEGSDRPSCTNADFFSFLVYDVSEFWGCCYTVPKVGTLVMTLRLLLPGFFLLLRRTHPDGGSRMRLSSEDTKSSMG